MISLACWPRSARSSKNPCPVCRCCSVPSPTCPAPWTNARTLVKDIVSGIFYLTDDAFRVGEFIDCEKAKGTVESFTLRSVRCAISLRFARDTDPDKLREATKKISADIMTVPELKEMLLEPLRMQGIAEVADNALVVRFKFVARPGNPSALQNEAVSRMLRSVPDLGVEFAK